MIVINTAINRNRNVENEILSVVVEGMNERTPSQHATFVSRAII